MDVPGVKLICYDPDSPYRVAAALLFQHTDVGLLELQEYCRKLPDEELATHSRCCCSMQRKPPP